MSIFDLKRYLDLFDAVCESKFGRTYDFRKLERKFTDVRKGKPLQAQQVMAVFDSEVTPFARYWAVPNRHEVERRLKTHPVILLLDDPARVVRAVLDVVDHVDTASLILRCVHPSEFAVYSVPVVNLVRVPAAPPIQHYLAYCAELKEWGQHFGLQTVAEADTALWTFHQKTIAGNNDQFSFAELNLFENDEWVQRRRAQLSIRPLIEKYGAIGLARVLIDTDTRLAAMLASEQFERLLELRGTGVKGLAACSSVSDKLKLLLRADRIAMVEYVELKDAVKVRNKAVHSAAPPRAEELENMIDIVERICGLWRQSPHVSGRHSPKAQAAVVR